MKLVSLGVAAVLAAGLGFGSASLPAEKEEAPVGQSLVSTAPKLEGSDVHWYTVEEFSKELEKNRKELKELAEKGEDGWTPEKAKEAIGIQEKMLQDLKNGMQLGKTEDGMISFSSDIGTATDGVQKEYLAKFDEGNSHSISVEARDSVSYVEQIADGAQEK